MTFRELTHGRPGFWLSYGSVGVPSAGALIRQRKYQMIILSPLLAIPALSRLIEAYPAKVAANARPDTAAPRDKSRLCVRPIPAHLLW